MVYKKFECPICHWKMFDCAAYDSGVCIVLTDVNFKRNMCPFYKSKRQVMIERLRAREKKKQNEE